MRCKSFLDFNLLFLLLCSKKFVPFREISRKTHRKFVEVHGVQILWNNSVKPIEPKNWIINQYSFEAYCENSNKVKKYLITRVTELKPHPFT